MSTELEALLDRVAPTPTGPPPIGHIIRRARRQRVALALVTVSCVALGIFAVNMVAGVVRQPSPDPAAPATGSIREAAQIPLVGSPNVLAYGEGGVWVGTWEGNIHRIDPSRDEVVATIPVLESEEIPGRVISDDGQDFSSAPPQPAGRFGTVTTGEGAIWVTASSGRSCRLFKIDPETNAVAAEESVPGCYPVVAADGAVWVGIGSLHGTPGRLLRLDTGTLEVTDEVDTGACCMSGITYAGGYIWVGRQDVGNVAGEIEDEGKPVIDMQLDLLQIDPTTRRIIREVPLAGDTYRPGDTVLSEAMTADSTAIWLTRPEAGELDRVDMAQGLVDLSAELPELRMPDNPVAVNGWLVVSDLNGSTIALVDGGSGNLVDVYDTNSLLAGDAATDGESFWVAHPEKNRVVRLRVAKG